MSDRVATADAIEVRFSIGVSQRAIWPNWATGSAIVAEVEVLSEVDGRVTSEVITAGKTLWPTAQAPTTVNDVLRGLIAGEPLRPLADEAALRATVTALFKDAIGTESLTALTARAQGCTRLVIQARDATVARLPFELAGLPDGTGKPLVALGVSILRTPLALDGPSAARPAPLEPKSGSVLQTVIVRTDDSFEGEGVEHHVAFRPADEFTPGVARPDVIPTFDAVAAGQERTVRPADLLVFAGHATPGAGFAGGGGHPSVTGAALAGAITRGSDPSAWPRVVLLAGCGSGEWPADDADPRFVALVDRVASRGIPLTIGFQDSTVEALTAFTFLKHLTRALDRHLAQPGTAPLGLAAWEDAIAEARGATTEASGSVVAYVNPALLLGRTSAAAGGRARMPQSAAIVAPYYVLGQLAWFVDPSEPANLLRVPLPVDIGARIGFGATAQEQRTVLGEALAGELIKAWPSASPLVLAARFIEHPGTRAAANAHDIIRARTSVRDAGNLSAVIRGCRAILGVDPPPAALALLAGVVAQAGGTPDGGWSVVDVQGRIVRRLERSGWSAEVQPKGHPVMPLLTEPGPWCGDGIPSASSSVTELAAAQELRVMARFRGAPLRTGVYGPLSATVTPLDASRPDTPDTPVLRGLPAGIPKPTVAVRLDGTY